MIKLFVIKDVPNEEYEEELKQYENGVRRNFDPDHSRFNYAPRKDKVVSLLDVYITDEQFEAIRKAVLEKF